MEKKVKSSNRTIVLVVIAVIVSVISISIGYSALESNLLIAGDASVRVKADIRISALNPKKMSNGAFETYSCTYSKDSTNFYVTLPNRDSLAFYDAEVTNYSSKKYVLKDIVVENNTNSAIVYSTEGLSPGNIIEPNSSVDFTVNFLYDTANTSNANSTTVVLKYIFEEYVEKQEDDPSGGGGLLLKDKILIDNGGSSAISAKGTPSFTSSSTSNEGMYASEDDDGTTYYFRGNVTNNYVLFGGLYWRVVRINGNGSIRLIYQGKNSTDSGSSSLSGSSMFNNPNFFGKDKSSHQHVVFSAGASVRSSLSNWYDSNMLAYENYLDVDAGFCNDVNDTSGNVQVSDSSMAVTYAGKNRLETTHSPTFKCGPTEYYYTSKLSSKGNKNLTSPIGLITLDEAYFAGGYTSSNSNYYLYNGSDYWTMTPYNFSMGFFTLGKSANEAMISSTGTISSQNVGDSSGVRPVINIKGTLNYKTGDGSSSNPYQIDTSSKYVDPSSYYNSTLVSAIKGLYENGDQYIHLHDSSLSTGANDGSYRYSGGNPHNYVCFGSDASTCPSGNLYRIIGAIDNKVKLVSADYVSSDMLGTNGGFISMNTNSSSTYKGSNSNIALYAYNNTNGSSSTNGWGGLLASVNLNNNFINNLPSNWSSKIVNSTWYVGNVSYFTTRLTPVLSVYNAEMNSSATKYNGKVGLLYAHEYGFGSSPSTWGEAMYSYSNTSIRNNNWLYLGLTEWTISHGIGGNNNNAATILYDGGFSYDKVYNGLPIRITFSLDTNTLLTGGTGEVDNPFRIS